jgi:hypothetical protein
VIERRKSSSGIALVVDTPFPRDAVRALRRALNAAYVRTRRPEVAALASSCAVVLAEAADRPGVLAVLASALRAAVGAVELQLGDDVDAAARAVKEALGVAGAVRDPGRSSTPYTAGEKGK